MANHRSFALRKLHSLAGVVPLGVFLAEHMYLNLFALKGAEAYNRIISMMQNLPYLVVIELGVIIIPLLYHGVYGLWISWGAKNNILQYRYYRNWMYYLQRAAGVITFIFVLYHVYSLRLKGLLFGQEVSFQHMAAQIRNPYLLVLYIFGLLSTFYHFANGLFTFAISWGLTVGPKSQRVANVFTWVVFLVMTVIGVNALLAFL